MIGLELKCSYCDTDLTNDPFWRIKDSQYVACVLCVPDVLGKKKADDYDRAMKGIKP